MTLGATPLDVAALAAIREPERFRYHSLGSIDAKIRIDRAILRPVTREFSPELVAIMRQSPTGPIGDANMDAGHIDRNAGCWRRRGWCRLATGKAENRQEKDESHHRVPV